MTIAKALRLQSINHQTFNPHICVITADVAQKKSPTTWASSNQDAPRAQDRTSSRLMHAHSENAHGPRFSLRRRAIVHGTWTMQVSQPIGIYIDTRTGQLRLIPRALAHSSRAVNSSLSPLRARSPFDCKYAREIFADRGALMRLSTYRYIFVTGICVLAVGALTRIRREAGFRDVEMREFGVRINGRWLARKRD